MITSIYVKQECLGGSESGASNVVSIFSGDTIANDWADRVETNGGVRPSVGSINASSTFVASLLAAGIWSKMRVINMMAPDNLIACQTPLLVGTGSDPWTNNLFVGGDLTVNGLNNTGTANLNSGFTPNPGFSSDNNAGATVYTFDAMVGDRCFVYCITGASYFGLYQTGGATRASFWTQSGGGEVSAGSNFNGYISGNRTGANALSIYTANSGTAHNLAGFNGGAVAGARPVETVPTHQYKLGGANGYYYTGRISFVAFHDGLAIAESLALYNAVKALRTSFGGGLV